MGMKKEAQGIKGKKMKRKKAYEYGGGVTPLGRWEAPR